VPQNAERGSGRLAWFLKLAAGLLIFWLAFRDIDPAAVARAFGLVNPVWLAAATASVFLTLALVVARWTTLLGASAEPRHTVVLLSAVIASQVSNIVMPFRLGDAVRIGAVSRALAVPPAEVLGSVAVERLFDGLLVAVTAGLLVAGGSLPAFARSGMLTLALIVSLALTAAVIAARVWPGSARGWIAVQIDHLVRGLERAANTRTATLALLWSCGVMGGSVLTAWLVLRAFQLEAPAISAAVIVIAVQVGSVVVPIPGAVGISQVLTVQTLRLWDVPEAPALAYALMLYLVARLPKIAVLPFALSALTAKPGAAD
jgi:hypothetical protein